jgi:hypothetical protein
MKACPSKRMLRALCFSLYLKVSQDHILQLGRKVLLSLRNRQAITENPWLTKRGPANQDAITAGLGDHPLEFSTAPDIP